MNELVVKVIPLFELGKRRMWYVCACPVEVWQELVIVSPPGDGKTRCESTLEIIATVKKWAVAWSSLPGDAEAMCRKLHRAFSATGPFMLMESERLVLRPVAPKAR